MFNDGLAMQCAMASAGTILTQVVLNLQRLIQLLNVNFEQSASRMMNFDRNCNDEAQ